MPIRPQTVLGSEDALPLAPLFVCLLALIPVAVMIGGRGDAGTLAAVGLTVAVVVGVMGSVA